MTSNVKVGISRIPSHIEDEQDRINWFMNRFGKSIVLDLPAYFYHELEQFFEKNPNINWGDLSIDIKIIGKESNGV